MKQLGEFCIAVYLIYVTKKLDFFALVATLTNLSWLICAVVKLSFTLHDDIYFSNYYSLDWPGSEIIQSTDEADEIDSIQNCLEWLKKATIYSWIKKFEHEYKTYEVNLGILSLVWPWKADRSI